MLRCLRHCFPAYWRVLQVPTGHNGCRALPLLFGYNERLQNSLRRESAHKQFSPLFNSGLLTQNLEIVSCSIICKYIRNVHILIGIPEIVVKPFKISKDRFIFASYFSKSWIPKTLNNSTGIALEKNIQFIEHIFFLTRNVITYIQQHNRIIQLLFYGGVGLNT